MLINLILFKTVTQILNSCQQTCFVQPDGVVTASTSRGKQGTDRLSPSFPDNLLTKTKNTLNLQVIAIQEFRAIFFYLTCGKRH